MRKKVSAVLDQDVREGGQERGRVVPSVLTGFFRPGSVGVRVVGYASGTVKACGLRSPQNAL